MLIKLKLKFIKSLKNKKLNVFGLFFLLAFLFLVLSKLSKTYIEPVSFKINYINVPKDVVIVSNNNQSLEVVVSSLGINLMPYYFYDNVINIDFKKDLIGNKDYYLWTAKESEYNIKAQLSKFVEIKSIKPDTLKLFFEKLESKKVPIELDSKITFASGYDLFDDFKIIPDSIKVIGSKTAVNAVNVVKTAAFKKENVKTKVEAQIGLLNPNTKNEIKLSQTNVKIIGDVEKFTEGVIEVPVTITNLPKDITINFFPKTISVSFYVPLSDYKEIKGLDFKVECDYNQVNKNNFLTPVLVKKPKKIKSARLKQNKVEFIIL